MPRAKQFQHLSVVAVNVLARLEAKKQSKNNCVSRASSLRMSRLVRSWRRPKPTSPLTQSYTKQQWPQPGRLLPRISRGGSMLCCSMMIGAVGASLAVRSGTDKAKVATEIT